MPEQINQNAKAFAGSNLLAISNLLLTDVAPVYATILACAHCNDILVSVYADKGCSIEITPIEDTDDESTPGLPGDIGVLDDGGGLGRWNYAKIGAPKVKITVTKTETGDCAVTRITTRGVA